MKVTLLNFMKAVSLVPYPLLIGYSLFVLKEFFPVPVLLGLEIFNLAFLKKTLRYETPEEKKVEEAGRITYMWMFIFFFMYLTFRETAYKWILFTLPYVSVAVFLAWIAYGGRWKESRSLLRISREKKDDCVSPRILRRLSYDHLTLHSFKFLKMCC